MNRYRVLPALVSGARRLGALRRNVRGEVVLAVCILAVTAVLSQLPPGKFVVEQAAAKPPAAPSVQVEGSDFATSVRIALTVSPGRPGPNSLHRQGDRLRLGRGLARGPGVPRFTAKGRPEIGASTLELARAGDGSGRPGQPALDRRDLGGGRPGRGAGPGGHGAHGAGGPRRPPAGQGVRGARAADPLHHHPGRRRHPAGLHRPWPAGPNTVHFTFFSPAGDEQPTDKARARMTRQSGATEPLTLIRLGPGHFANVDLEPGRVAFAIDATTGKTQRQGRFEQLIE